MDRLVLVWLAILFVLQATSAFHAERVALRLRPVSRDTKWVKNVALCAKKKRSKARTKSSGDVEDIMDGDYIDTSFKVLKRPEGSEDSVTFPELEQTGIDEKKLRESPIGKVFFGVLDLLFPVFSEPNWFDIYDPPLSKEKNMELPYFDGYDFVNSTWTVYIRHRYVFK